jgi:hypothetical protein
MVGCNGLRGCRNCRVGGFPYASGGPIAGLGFGILAVLWVGTTLGAWRAAVQRRFALHRLLIAVQLRDDVWRGNFAATNSSWVCAGILQLLGHVSMAGLHLLDSERLRGGDLFDAERKVEDAAANPGSPVGDTNYYGLAARKISYTNSCAERQVAVGSGQ